jgi:hypothetical protein
MDPHRSAQRLGRARRPRRALCGTEFLYHAIGYLLRFAHVIRADLYDFAGDDVADGIVTID